ncbi:MAG TPA: hypothetical protein VGJ26_00950 [Pirellulales bacterium]|jgi:hypothetical protein
MKKLGFLALLLSIGVASIGCEPAKKNKDKPMDKPAETKPVDPAAPAAPAEPAAPATPAAPEGK